MSVRTNIVANFSGKATIVLSTLILTPFLIRVLGIENYGLIGFYNVLLLVANTLDLGLGLILQKEMAKEKKDFKLFSFCKMVELTYLLILVLFISAFLVSVKSLSVYWFRSDNHTAQTIANNLYLSGLSVLCLGPFSLYSNALLGLGKHVFYNGVLIVFTLLRSIGAFFILSLISSRLEAFFLWQLAINASQMILTRYVFFRQFKVKAKGWFNPSFFRERRDQFFAIGGKSGTDFLLVYLDKIILSKLLNLKDFGYFNLAWLLSSALFNLIHPIFMAIFPKFSSLIKENKWTEVKQLYHAATQLMVIAVVPIAAICFFYGEELVTFWTKNASLAQHVAPILKILVIGTAFCGISHVTSSVQMTSYLESMPFKLNLLNLLIYLFLGPFAYIHFGLFGIAGMWAIINMVYVFIGGVWMHQKVLQTELSKWLVIDLLLPSIFVTCLVLFVSKWLIITNHLVLIFGLFTLYIACLGMLVVYSKVLRVRLDLKNFL
jgi:O-antigen/teichoic acid export membrane protein